MFCISPQGAPMDRVSLRPVRSFVSVPGRLNQNPAPIPLIDAPSAPAGVGRWNGSLSTRLRRMRNRLRLLYFHRITGRRTPACGLGLNCPRRNHVAPFLDCHTTQLYPPPAPEASQGDETGSNSPAGRPPKMAMRLDNPAQIGHIRCAALQVTVLFRNCGTQQCSRRLWWR